MLIDDLLGCPMLSALGNLDEGLVKALCFQVDNVASYAYSSLVSTSNIPGQIKVYEHIPNVAPLAPIMWFEFGGLAKGGGKPATNRYGCLISIDYDKKDQCLDEWDTAELPDDTRWILRTQCFAKNTDGIQFMRWAHYIAIAEDGGFIGPAACEFTNPYMEPTAPKGDLYNEELVALLAICFTHCRGTDVKEQQPSRQVRRAAERTSKPAFSFHTINIHPSTQVLQSEGQINKNGLAKALHICRGHFAHYTAERPLFGKYTGTFYRPMHVRGSADHGIAGKNYRVHANGGS